MLERARKLADLDPVVHAPVRLALLSILSEVKEADFTFLLNLLGVTRGNLSIHASRLVRAGYVNVTKGFKGKVPRTTYRITRSGRTALARHMESIAGFTTSAR